MFSCTFRYKFCMALHNIRREKAFLFLQNLQKQSKESWAIWGDRFKHRGCEVGNLRKANAVRSLLPSHVRRRSFIDILSARYSNNKCSRDRFSSLPTDYQFPPGPHLITAVTIYCVACPVENCFVTSIKRSSLAWLLIELIKQLN